ncbi:hypothetical protein ACP70R_020741 [Stipagrostis hirtigluma subsp. patula]
MPREEPMDPRLLRFLVRAVVCVARRPEAPEALLVRLLLRLPLRLARLLPPFDAAPPRRMAPEDQPRLLLPPPAPTTTTSAAPTTTTSAAPTATSAAPTAILDDIDPLLLLVAVRRFASRLSPRPAAPEGRAPAAALVLLLVVREAVLRCIAPPSTADAEGHLVAPLPVLDGLLSALYRRVRSLPAPTLLHLLLVVALRRWLRRSPRAGSLGGGRRLASRPDAALQGSATPTPTPTAADWTMLDLVPVVALPRLFARLRVTPRVAALGGGSMEPPPTLLHRLRLELHRRAARPHAALQSRVMALRTTPTLAAALRRLRTQLFPPVAALGGGVRIIANVDEADMAILEWQEGVPDISVEIAPGTDYTTAVDIKRTIARRGAQAILRRSIIEEQEKRSENGDKGRKLDPPSAI